MRANCSTATTTRVDPVVLYTWSLGDDLTARPARTRRGRRSASAGYYDLVMRVDTGFGSYRITNYSDTFDVVENLNLWLWTFVRRVLRRETNTVRATEYGLVSESVQGPDDGRPAGLRRLVVPRRRPELVPAASPSSSGTPGSPPGAPRRPARAAFCTLYWATGRSAVRRRGGRADRTRRVQRVHRHLRRPTRPWPPTWNWVYLNSSRGVLPVRDRRPRASAPNTSPTTSQSFLTHDLLTLTAATTTALTPANYLGGAAELDQQRGDLRPGGEPTYGHFSVYRSCLEGLDGILPAERRGGAVLPDQELLPHGGDDVTDARAERPEVGRTCPARRRWRGSWYRSRPGCTSSTTPGSVSAYNDTTGVWSTPAAPGSTRRPSAPSRTAYRRRVRRRREHPAAPPRTATAGRT
jgi:hypothetical protein